MSGLQVGAEVAPSRREWVTAAARFFSTHARPVRLWATFAAGSVLIMMGDLRRWQRPDHDLGRLDCQPRGQR
jgi:hypothetical protein